LVESLILIVDDKDNVIGSASITEARSKGIRHRISRVIVKDSEGRILLQKRADHMQTYPGRWDTSAAGHVDMGEDYMQAAKREMLEEVGLKASTLREVDYYKSEDKYEEMDIRRFNKTFETAVKPGTRFRPNPDEVSAVEWFSAEQLKDVLQTNPHSLTDGLVNYIQRHL
jgi:isopentenyl-diphosphate delta-isomerase